MWGKRMAPQQKKLLPFLPGPLLKIVNYLSKPFFYLSFYGLYSNTKPSANAFQWAFFLPPFEYFTKAGFSWQPWSEYMSYFDSSRRHTTTHATGTRIVRAKMTSFDAIFCRGSKWSSALSLAFAAENIKNLPFALRAREKVWARLVDKSNMMLVRQKLSLEVQFTISYLLDPPEKKARPSEGH